MYHKTLFTAVLAFLAVHIAASGATIEVPSDYPTIQEAIDAASAGDVVLVAPDRYIENIDFNGKAITVRSEQGPETTIIDGNNWISVVTFDNAEGADSVLEGFTITNGHAAYQAGGGGISCYPGASPTIRRNVITANDVGGAPGGGIYCEGSAPLIERNLITGNNAAYGGGISCRSNAAPHITGNTISDNVAAQGGGGIECYRNAAPSIVDNVIERNVTTTTWSYGGGIHCADNSPAFIEGNTISANTAAHSGGGIYDHGASPTIQNNLIVDNNAQNNNGGGIYTVNYTTTEISGNMIVHNRAGWDGGGIYTWYDDRTTVTGNTIVSNTAAYSGGGIHCGAWSFVVITNTILWANSAPHGNEIYVGVPYSPGECTIDYSDLDGHLSGVYVDGGTFNYGLNMYTIDPGFADETNRDYHILYTSPVRNCGDGSASGMASEDFEGDPRIVEGGVDIGADEFYYHLYHLGSVVPGDLIEIKVAGIPAYPVTLFLGSAIQDPPYHTVHGDFFLSWPVLWQGALGAVRPDGILTVPVSVPLTWNQGEQKPLQALVGYWGDPLTRLTNLELLTVE